MRRRDNLPKAASRTRVLLFNKPYQVLSTFTGENGQRCLGDYLDAPGFYAAGRLDFDSEGLLVLTDNGRIQARLSQPRFKVRKTYFVQVEGVAAAAHLQALRKGVTLNDGPTQPADAEAVVEPAWLWPRTPPIRARRQLPTSWIRLTLREGRNRQVRRMTAVVGLPTLRLIRWSVGPWNLAALGPGQFEFRDVTPGLLEGSFDSRPEPPL